MATFAMGPQLTNYVAAIRLVLALLVGGAVGIGYSHILGFYSISLAGAGEGSTLVYLTAFSPVVYLSQISPRLSGAAFYGLWVITYVCAAAGRYNLLCKRAAIGCLAVHYTSAVVTVIVGRGYWSNVYSAVQAIPGAFVLCGVIYVAGQVALWLWLLWRPSRAQAAPNEPAN